MKILFFGDAIGQLNNCIAIAQQAEIQGIEVAFMVGTDFKTHIEQAGFDVEVLEPGSTSNVDFHQQVNQTLEEWDKPPLEQIEHYIGPYYELIVEGAIAINDAMTKAIDRHRPDLIIVDDVVGYPAIINSDIPWVRVISCDETEIPDTAIPPHLSGLPEIKDEKWLHFQEKLNTRNQATHKRLNAFLKQHQIPKLREGMFISPSPHLNVLLCPESVAFKRQQPLSDTFLYANGCIRQTEPFTLPTFSADLDKAPLIYFSFGTMGTDAVEYTYELLNAFRDKPFKVIASVGIEHIQNYKNLPDNIKVYDYLPQPSLIEQSDLVIFHGGNNTNNECYFYGKPVIVIPFAWDEHAVAMRRQELGLGHYLVRKQFSPDLLPPLSTESLQDKEMLAKLAEISQSMQATPGPEQIMSKIHELELQTHKHLALSF